VKTVHLYVTHTDGEADSADIVVPDDIPEVEIRRQAVSEYGHLFAIGDTVDMSFENEFAPFLTFVHQNRMLHTDMPLIPLSFMVGDLAMVNVDTADAGTTGACFYGWGEARNGSDCPPHHLVSTPDDIFLDAIVEAVMGMGHQVVVTDYHDWSEDVQAHRYHAHHDH
jgi:hypothetical protein